jgi:hypothetical protein
VAPLRGGDGAAGIKHGAKVLEMAQVHSVR